LWDDELLDLTDALVRDISPSDFSRSEEQDPVGGILPELFGEDLNVDFDGGSAQPAPTPDGCPPPRYQPNTEDISEADDTEVRPALEALLDGAVIGHPSSDLGAGLPPSVGAREGVEVAEAVSVQVDDELTLDGCPISATQVASLVNALPSFSTDEILEGIFDRVHMSRQGRATLRFGVEAAVATHRLQAVQYGTTLTTVLAGGPSSEQLLNSLVAYLHAAMSRPH